MTGGEGYARRHLQQSDYYDQNRTVKGQWHGRGAELVGLKGEVTSEEFEAVRQGLDPRTGDFLRQRHGRCNVPLDSLNVPKSTSRRFRHFKQSLRNVFEVKIKKDSLRRSNKCALYDFYTNNVPVRHDAKTNASRVVSLSLDKNEEKPSTEAY